MRVSKQRSFPQDLWLSSPAGYSYGEKFGEHNTPSLPYPEYETSTNKSGTYHRSSACPAGPHFPLPYIFAFRRGHLHALSASHLGVIDPYDDLPL